jgi:hypothetical protein
MVLGITAQVTQASESPGGRSWRSGRGRRGIQGPFECRRLACVPLSWRARDGRIHWATRRGLPRSLKSAELWGKKTKFLGVWGLGRQRGRVVSGKAGGGRLRCWCFSISYKHLEQGRVRLRWCNCKYRAVECRAVPGRECRWVVMWR